MGLGGRNSNADLPTCFRIGFGKGEIGNRGRYQLLCVFGSKAIANANQPPSNQTSRVVAARFQHPDEIKALHLLVGVGAQRCRHNGPSTRARYHPRQQTMSEQLGDNTDMQKS